MAMVEDRERLLDALEAFAKTGNNDELDDVLLEMSSSDPTVEACVFSLSLLSLEDKAYRELAERIRLFLAAGRALSPEYVRIRRRRWDWSQLIAATGLAVLVTAAATLVAMVCFDRLPAGGATPWLVAGMAAVVVASFLLASRRKQVVEKRLRRELPPLPEPGVFPFLDAAEITEPLREIPGYQCQAAIIVNMPTIAGWFAIPLRWREKLRNAPRGGRERLAIWGRLPLYILWMFAYSCLLPGIWGIAAVFLLLFSPILLPIMMLPPAVWGWTRTPAPEPSKDVPVHAR